MAEKCSVLKPWRLRNLKLFLSFSCYNFKCILIQACSKKNLTLVQNFIVKCLCLFESVYKTEKTI